MSSASEKFGVRRYQHVILGDTFKREEVEKREKEIEKKRKVPFIQKSGEARETNF